MTNKEKASLIAEQWVNGGVWAASKVSALEMAEWKDNQVKEYLEKKRESLLNTNCLGVLPYIDLIDEIINELFKED